MWGAVEVAWERYVINGDARSRAAFFSYVTVSLVGLKGVDKFGKAGKVGNATSKADTSEFEFFFDDLKDNDFMSNELMLQSYPEAISKYSIPDYGEFFRYTLLSGLGGAEKVDVIKRPPALAGGFRHKCRRLKSLFKAQVFLKAPIMKYNQI